MSELRWKEPEARRTMRRLCVERAIARGDCRQCFLPIGPDPRHPAHRKGPPKMCRTCLDKAGDLNRKRRETRIAAGLCICCGHTRAGADAATTGTGTMCRPCSDRVNVRSNPSDRARYIRLREAGVCTHCGKPAKGKLCRDHADQHNARKRLNRAREKGHDGPRGQGWRGRLGATKEPASSPD